MPPPGPCLRDHCDVNGLLPPRIARALPALPAIWALGMWYYERPHRAAAPKEINIQFASSLIWLRRLVVVGSVVACAAASAIGASASPTVGAPDVVERYAATHDPNSATAPDALERYVTAHSLGLTTVVPAVGTARLVDDWYRDPKPVATSVGDRIVDASLRCTDGRGLAQERGRARLGRFRYRRRRDAGFHVARDGPGHRHSRNATSGRQAGTS